MAVQPRMSPSGLVINHSNCFHNWFTTSQLSVSRLESPELDCQGYIAVCDDFFKNLNWPIIFLNSDWQLVFWKHQPWPVAVREPVPTSPPRLDFAFPQFSIRTTKDIILVGIITALSFFHSLTQTNTCGRSRDIILYRDNTQSHLTNIITASTSFSEKNWEISK